MTNQTEEIKHILRDFRDVEDENGLDATARKLQEAITGIEETHLDELNEAEFGQHLKIVANELQRRYARESSTTILLGLYSLVDLISEY